MEYTFFFSWPCSVALSAQVLLGRVMFLIPVEWPKRSRLQFNLWWAGRQSSRQGAWHFSSHGCYKSCSCPAGYMDKSVWAVLTRTKYTFFLFLSVQQ